MDLGSMAIKDLFACPRSPALLESHYLIFSVLLGGAYPFAEMQSVYSAGPADWAIS